MKTLKHRDKQIKELAMAEKFLLERLHNTIQVEEQLFGDLYKKKQQQASILNQVENIDVAAYTAGLIAPTY